MSPRPPIPRFVRVALAALLDDARVDLAEAVRQNCRADFMEAARRHDDIAMVLDRAKIGSKSRGSEDA